MVQVKYFLLLAALCACCGLGSVVPDKPEKPVIINVSAPTKESKVEGNDVPKETTKIVVTTEAIPVTASTVTEPSDKPADTNTTSTTTTTPAPAPPTPPPTPKPTPPPAPGPVPPPEQHTWWYHNDTSNITCIVAQFAAQLNLNYSTTENGTATLAQLTYNIPANATVLGGSCDPYRQFLTLSWPAPAPANATASVSNNTMTLVYAKNETTKSYGLVSLDLNLAPETFRNPSFSTVAKLWYGEAWQTPLKTSYRCAPAARLNMTGDPVSNTAGYLTFTKVQEEAFRGDNTTQFSAARECGGDVPDAVPIAVGCALGGLVLVVLVAYLVGRRRSSARGYLSM